MYEYIHVYKKQIRTGINRIDIDSYWSVLQMFNFQLESTL